jgi:hypothetical protein
VFAASENERYGGRREEQKRLRHTERRGRGVPRREAQMRCTTHAPILTRRALAGGEGVTGETTRSRVFATTRGKGRIYRRGAEDTQKPREEKQISQIRGRASQVKGLARNESN